MATFEQVTRIFPAIAGTVVAALVSWLLFSTAPTPSIINNAAKIACVLAAAGGAVGITRYGLRDVATAPGNGVPPSDESGLRDRIAPLIIGIGTVGIAAIAIVVLVVIYRSKQGDVPAASQSIFTAVLPVFATWVGTVIAFYFTNESYRQAAQSNRALLTPSDDDEPITSHQRMIPYEKITKMVTGVDGVPLDPKQIAISDVRVKFSDTVSRLIIFSDQKKPLYIIRKKHLENVTPATLENYLDMDGYLVDATNFAFIAAQLTVGDARRQARMLGTVDLFVTDRGTALEPIKGWVTDDKLT